MLTVETGSRSTEPHAGDILLPLGLQGVDPLGRPTDADQQHPRSQRIERSGVTDLDLAKSRLAKVEFHLAHDVRRTPAIGLVDHGDIALLEVYML